MNLHRQENDRGHLMIVIDDTRNDCDNDCVNANFICIHTELDRILLYNNET